MQLPCGHQHHQGFGCQIVTQSAAARQVSPLLICDHPKTRAKPESWWFDRCAPKTKIFMLFLKEKRSKFFADLAY